MNSTPPLVTIFGGSGFLGRYIAQRMAHQGWRVRVAVRRPNEAMFVQPYGQVGQVVPIQANIRDDASTRAAIAGADAVINCVGILAENSRQKFDTVQADGAARIAQMAAEAGVAKFVHISSLGADADSDSKYLQTKAEGEAAVLAAYPNAVILRPSVMFGTDDSFFNKYGTMARYYPILGMVLPDAKFQPVFVDDVAAAAQAAVLGDATGIYELGGPDIDTFKGLTQRVMTSVRRHRFLIKMPLFIGKICALSNEIWHKATLGIVPLALTRDQIKMRQSDNVVSEGAQTLADLGVDATAMDTILDSYLYRFRPQGQYTDLTSSAKNLRG
ncbi:MAG: complex I NDUFA9 subunit family protein [Rhodobacteraceae bacterium]|nr:complex I NDUFA9 subunit family protein [Paracoccaceae bacterium]